jgi:hypothetical protein
MTAKYTKRPQNIPNDHKVHIPNGHEINQKIPFQGIPKFTKIMNFGL